VTQCTYACVRLDVVFLLHCASQKKRSVDDGDYDDGELVISDDDDDDE